MRRYLKLTGLMTVLVALMLSGCVQMQSSTIGEREGPGHGVSASADDFGFLRLTVPSGLTGTVNTQLTSGCPGGKFTNAQTELTLRDFILVQLYTVTASAVCQ